jgi:L-rhamnose isomerase
VGARATQQAFLIAMLEPTKKMLALEEKGQYFERLAYLEIMKTRAFGAVWDYYCLVNGVSVGEDYVAEIQRYEKSVLEKR